MIVFKPRKVSIIIPIYNSPGAARRQVLHFAAMKLPDSVEILFMDDGSDPPLKPFGWTFPNFNIYPTGDTRPWTQTAAKNLGVKISEGEYVLVTDVDHIITREMIDAVLAFDGDKMEFSREWGVLNNHGEILRDPETLYDYGLEKWRFARRGYHVHIHTNTYAMKREIYIAIGGYPPKYAEQQRHHIYDDNHLYNKYLKHVRAGKYKPAVLGPTVLTFPNHGKDVKGLFHNLGRDR